MQRITWEELLNIKDSDLVIENYHIGVSCVEAKLKCGLYAYCTGSTDSEYGRIKFSFTGTVKALIILKKPRDEIATNQNDRFIFSKEYLKYFDETKKFDKNDPRYLKIEQIAKNIIQKSNCKIYFQELESYINYLQEEDRKKWMALWDGNSKKEAPNELKVEHDGKFDLRK